MSRNTRTLLWVVAACALVFSACRRQPDDRSRGEAPAPSAATAPSAAAAPADDVRVGPASDVTVPDEELVDQDGAPVRLRDLLADRVVAVSFVFTTCTTICSPMTATFAKVQEELGDAMERRVRLVTISIDPAVDTPERLKRYAERFDRRPGWTFLTGTPERVGRVLDALGGRAVVKEQHAPMTLISSEGGGRWTRVDGLAPAKRLTAEIRACAAEAERRAADAERTKIGGATGDADAAAAKYFTDTELVDQDGRPRRFYRDLIRGRKVLINFAFTACKGVCPVMTANLARVRTLLGARVGKEVTLLTITVDPVNDTPRTLKQFAAKHGAGPGWYFLTGTPENVSSVLKRLGGLAAKPEEHASILLIGDAVTGTWVKSMATERPETIVYLLDHLDAELGPGGAPAGAR